MSFDWSKYERKKLEVYIMAKSSKKYEMNKEDMTKVAVGLGIALGGAALTFAADMIPNIDFGVYTPMVVALSSTLINLARKWLKEN